MNKSLTIALIGGGNMAWALAGGLADRICPAANIHVIDINADIRARWQARGMSVATTADEALTRADVWIYAVKPQGLREVASATRPYLRPETLVISIAAGIRGDTLAHWLGEPGHPMTNLVRCMPNTPALVGAGATGIAALAGVSEQSRALVQSIFSAVGEVVWVADDAALDAVTALSGSGPAYVFLFIESLIQGGEALGLTPEQARLLALATLSGATRLASESSDSPATLRQNVTSKGGTTAAALDVFGQAGLTDIVGAAMKAACDRSAALARDAEK